jgi:hypothetical protein
LFRGQKLPAGVVFAKFIVFHPVLDEKWLLRMDEDAMI